MRRVRFSKTYGNEFEALLSQGLRHFSVKIVQSKRQLVRATIHQFLVRHPARPVDPVLGICAYEVSNTPFVLLYDYDDAELRVHFVIHKSADRTKIDLSKIDW